MEIRTHTHTHHLITKQNSTVKHKVTFSSRTTKRDTHKQQGSHKQTGGTMLYTMLTTPQTKPTVYELLT